MRKIIGLIGVLTLMLFSAIPLKATHMLGGEITWRCIPGTGQFRFYMELYRNCATPSGGTAAGWTFQTENLRVIGGPRRTNNSIITTIPMKPDSTTWNNQNLGQVAPECNAQGTRISCGNPDFGSVQRYFYVSDPITLKGVPPTSGWHFYFQTPCCRPTLDNMTTASQSSGIVLRAVMYADKNNTNTQNCRDNSPAFREIAANLICRGYTFTFNHNAYDNDLDSLSYKWATPINSPPPSGTPTAYNPGFAFNSPTPNSNVNNQNKALSLDPITGQMEVALYSGFGSVGKYATCVQVDQWRDGKKIGSVFREIPFYFFDCATVTTGYNNPPIISINNNPNPIGEVVELTAGQKVEIPFNAADFDISNTGSPQIVTLVPNGFMFSTDFTSENNCNGANLNGQSVNLAPCAYLRNNSVTFNGSTQPPRYEIKGFSGVSTVFNWQTECHHLRTAGSGIPGASSGIYNFVMKVQDDNCQIPSVNYPVITVKLTDPLPIEPPIMKGISVGLDGKITYQWAPPTDTSNTWDNYQVQQSSVNDGSGPAFIGMFNQNLRKYSQEQKVQNYPIYVNTSDIRFKIPGKDWYFRMKSESGCTGDVESAWGEAARVIEVEATPNGNVANGRPLRSNVRLDWNRAKPLNASSDPLYKYESQTHYYIWKNDNVATAADARNLANWVLIGDTNATTYDVPTSTCNGYVGFRIEARDTVVMLEQGERVRKQRFDSLFFSSFSVVDTVWMRNSGNVPQPHFDTIQVLANGDVYFSIDVTSAGTAGTFEIYQGTPGASNPAPTLLTSLTAPNGQYTHVGAAANLAQRSYFVVAIDKCDNNNVASSPEYKTLFPGVSVQNPACNGIYDITWQSATGLLPPVRNYKLYFSNDGSAPDSLLRSFTNGNTSFSQGINYNNDYRYQVVATDRAGSVSISSIAFIAANPNVRTFEIVPAPELRCIYVHNDNTVALSWLKPRDSTDNFVSYDFEYRIDGGQWQDIQPQAAFTNINLDTFNFTINGFQALNSDLDFRAYSISGCNGTDPSPASDIISMINMKVSSNVKKHGLLNWNETGVANDLNNFPYRLYRDPNNGDMSSRILTGFVKSDNFIDSITSVNLCNAPGFYRVQIYDPIGQCWTRSNYDSAMFVDQAPEKQWLDYITVTQDNEISIQWSRDVEPDVDSQWVIMELPGIAYNQVDSLAINSSRRYFSDPNQFNVMDTVVRLALQPKDVCDNRPGAGEFDFHTTMDIDAVWNPCDSLFELSWNPYKTFNVGDSVSYVVYWDTTGGTGNAEPLAATLDTTTRHILDASYGIGDVPVEFEYYVKARPTNTNRVDIESRSNRETAFAVYGTLPDYNYTHYANVLRENQVEIQVYPDLNPILFDNLGHFVVRRGINSDEMTPIGSVDKFSIVDSTFRYYDYTAATNDYSYFYQVVVENVCGNPIDTSNYGRTIHLTVDADNEALTNTLRWNEYEGWDSAAAFYKIYRSFNEGGFSQYDVVPALGEGNINLFVDDVYNELFAIGDFCYFVEAVQGPVTTDFGIGQDLDPAVSRSNHVCVIQKPLFYIPNAFAPDGVNKVFGPQGHFVDWAYYEMIIYNRWGEQVYSTNDPRKGWDGKMNGQDPQAGSYVYTIRFQDAEGKEHRRKGTVTVIK